MRIAPMHTHGSTFLAEKLPSLLKKFEKSFPPPLQNSPWLVGAKLSLADLCIFGFLATKCGVYEHNPFLYSPEACAKAFEECPRIKASIEAAAALPDLKAYLAYRDVHHDTAR